MLRKLTLSVSALLCALCLLAQDPTGGVRGTVVSRADRSAVAQASITLSQGSSVIARTTTDQDGNFLFPNLADGMYDLVIEAEEFVSTRVNVTVNDGYVKNMFSLSLTPSQVLAELDASNFAELDMDDSGYSDNPTILFGQNDVYNSIAGYNFSTVRFRNRGYSAESQDVRLAGVKMNDALSGASPFSLWSGLNEATRTKDSFDGAEVADFGFGGYNGVTNIPVTASYVRKGWRGSVLTNSALYRLRLMMTYASGPLDNGWSYAFSASARLGGNDWIDGVYYRSFAYYASAEKKFNDVHKLSAAFMATPGQRGAQNASTQEVYDLVGDNMYNSNWGYQNGKMRNARVRKTHEPIALLRYDFTPSDDFKAGVTALFRFGKNGYTALDWHDAADPRPDYYRNLPSYFYMEESDYNRNNQFKADWAEDLWTRGYDQDLIHVNWTRLYNVNQNNLDANGRLRSKYVQEERRVDQRDFNLSGNVKWRADRNFTLTGGFDAKINRTENYKILADLLGGDYFLNIDNFAEREYAATAETLQNDLNYYWDNGSAKSLSKGDKYGYDYYAHVRSADLWAKLDYSYGAFTASAAGTVGAVGFWREGLVRKGLFAGLDENGKEIYASDGTLLTSYDPLTGEAISSYGDSEHKNFLTYGAKGRLEYRIGGNMRVYGNVGYLTEAPTFNKSFLSPRTRNSLVNNLVPVKNFTADINWQLTQGNWNARVSAFYTTIKDQTDVMSYYDDLKNAFTNLALSGIDERHMGIELGFKVPTPVNNLYLQGALSYGEYIYTSNPRMTQTVDNRAELVTLDEIVPYWQSHPVFRKDASGNYVKDAEGNAIFDHNQKHYVPSTPQLAGSIGLAWNYNYWFIDFDFEYFANSYLDMNPVYRTDYAAAGPDNHESAAEIEYMASQEKFDPAHLLNINIGKSWYIQRKYQIGFSFNAKNVLNEKNIKTGGYEQTRLVDNTVSKERYYRFDSKYFYLNGANYMLNVYFRF